MPKRDYNKLSRLLDSLVPTDAVLRHSWLFDWLSHHPQIPIGQPMEAHDSKFFADRKIAIREVIQQGGAKDVLRLAQDCRDKTLPGLLVARERLLSPKELGLDDLLLSDDPAEKQLAHGYVFGYVEAGKSSSLLRKAAGWSVLAQARLAMWMPFGVRTWNWIDKRGAKARSIYWKNCSQFGTEKNIRSVRRAVQSLLDVHRPFSAIYVVSRALQSDIAIRTPEIIRVLLAGQAKSVEPAGQSLSYSVQQLFKVLQSDGNVDLQQLAMLEWDYFDLLDIHSEVTWDGIYRALAESAETFVSLVKWMVRAEGEPARKRPVSAIEQRNGERAFTIVQNANKIPGVSNDQLNSDILKNWIKEARVRASKCKRLSITEGLIGNLLARCPSDHNGKWPHRELCSVLENHASDGILEGYTLELMKQDPTWRAPTDGGTIEREESRSLRNAAAEILYEFPRVSKSIEAAADFFERSAVRHDQSANRFRIGR